jgi:hypothetical protein
VRRIAWLLGVTMLVVPARGAEKVTVRQLGNRLATLHGKPDSKAANAIAGLELTERTTERQRGQLEASLPGQFSRRAFEAVADAASFLALPPADVPTDAPLDKATQVRILSLAAGFAKAETRYMPNFMARRTTTRYRDAEYFPFARQLNMRWLYTPGDFHLVDRNRAEVRYLNGKGEDDISTGKRGKKTRQVPAGLNTWGEFGPLLTTVMKDIQGAKVEWSHWERSSAGPVVVLRYAVGEDKSGFRIRFCCFQNADGELVNFEAQPGYHGEIAIESASGKVVRLTVVTDLDPKKKLFRVDQSVEYGPVEIAGRVYMLPRRSVSVCGTREMVVTDVSSNFPQVDGFTMTLINDIVFDEYHVFRGEVRILPPAEDVGPAAPGAATSEKPLPKQ